MSFDLAKNYPGSVAINFLHQRILANQYRGKHLSQHNRYDLGVVKAMLKTLRSYTSISPMIIRTTDLKKRPHNFTEEASYASYVNDVIKLIGRGTQDSIRKNLFVEFSRMGFLNRYDKNLNKLNPFKKGNAKFVELSKFGLDFILENNIFNSSMIYARAVDNVLLGMATDIFQAMIEIDYITLDEYTYFMSFIGCNLNNKTYYFPEIIDFIKEFRKFSTYQKLGIKNLIKSYCNPKTFTGSKKIKRDLHNWINEAQQIFTILNDTAYYEFNKPNSRLEFKLNSKNPSMKPKRSIFQKENYFKFHSVNKVPGYQLHHIVPLFWAKTPNEFKVLDKWENMIYIDAKSHAIITNNSPDSVELAVNNGNIRLINKVNKYIELVKNQNALFDDKNLNNMIKVNLKLLNSF